MPRYTLVPTRTAAPEGKTGVVNEGLWVADKWANSVTGSFATPDLLNNADFENSWSGFQDDGGGNPSGGYVMTVTDNTADGIAKTGTYSVKVTYGQLDGTNDDSIKFQHSFTGTTAPYARVWFYRTGTIPNDHCKWIRFQNQGFDAVRGGLYLSSLQNDITWCEAADSNIDVKIGTGVPTANAWHSIEVQYDRSTYNVPGQGPRKQFWYDGNQQVGPAPGGGSASFWGRADGTPDAAGPWLYAGATDAAYTNARLVFCDTLNKANTAAGVYYFDRVAVSTQRIGP